LVETQKKQRRKKMENSKKLEKINSRIANALADPRLTCSYDAVECSVHCELRLSVRWGIRLPVDSIHYPKSLGPETEEWQKIRKLASDISGLARISSNFGLRTKKMNLRTKEGRELRHAELEKMQIEEGELFLSAHEAAVRKIPALTKKIATLQAEQKALLPELRRANSQFLASRKSQKAAARQADTEALASGRFWEASRETLKDYFHPPFDRNYLADVSAKWRAALYTEMGSTAWKDGKGDWRHKNIGTGRGYLCGIDDNGDEWGHSVDLRRHVGQDAYGDFGYVATVEDAISELCDVSLVDLQNCSLHTLQIADAN
jgi:hypothetical protein